VRIVVSGDSTKEGDGEDPAGVLASGGTATAGTSTSTGTGMAPSTSDDMVRKLAGRLLWNVSTWCSSGPIKNIDQYRHLCCRHSVLGLHPFVVYQAIMFDDEAWNMCDDDADLLDLSSDGKNKANAAVVTGV
jgi:hypothetical protein